MPTYVALLRYTEEGLKTIKEGPSRLDQAKAAVEAAGGKVKDFYLTMGRYDGVFIADFPNDETAARVLLNQASQGTSRIETLRAFGEPAYRDIISSIKK